MSHHCSCHSIQPSTFPELLGLIIRATTPQVQWRFLLLLRAHEVQVRVDGDSLFVAAADVCHLEAVLMNMTSIDRMALQAMPHTQQGPQVWELRPLHQWIARLASSWFCQATQHLKFHAQPIVQLRGGQVLGYEALVRADLGGQLIGAGALLDAAEAHNQLRAFDALARTTAIRQLYPRLAAGEFLFLNFAPGVIYNPDVCLQTTFQACREVGADFSRLVFEVTEGEQYPDLPLLRSILERYRREGAWVALDDLGSGHSSLAYLEELRPDLVKLDRSLIKGLHKSPTALRLVTALTRYAHDLDIRVVAEGIEQREELEALKETGVDFVQGYFLGRPSETLGGVAAAAKECWTS